MKKNYEITEKQLIFLENYLKKKKRFSDPEDLYELIDHLILDFEATTENGNLSQYLADNSSFINNYKGSKANKERALHWQYQREVWKLFFSFCYKPKYLPFTILIGSIFYILFIKINLSDRFLGVTFLTFVIMFSLLSWIKTYHKKKEIKQLISFKVLSNIMSLPAIFICAFSFVLDFFNENRFRKICEHFFCSIE